MKTARFLAGIVFFCISARASASHIRSVEISARTTNCNTFTYEITIIGYINLSSGVRFGGDNAVLTFGDGQQLIVPELLPVVVDPILNVGKVVFNTIHTYAAAGGYVLSYIEANRNEGIINMATSITTPFYTETYITIAPGFCNSSPILSIPPIDRACTGITFYHNPGAVDADDDSLSYELIIPKQNLNTVVTSYSLPTDPSFYGAEFNTGNEEENGPPLISIAAADGTLTWDAPGTLGEYAIALKVIEWKWKPEDSTWYETGYVVRDMQIIVEDCNNRKPDIDVPEEICVIAGSKVEFKTTAIDADHDNVVIEAFSDIFSLTENPGVVAPISGALQSTSPPNDTAAMTFSWSTTCAHIKSQPYKLIFKITDRPPDGPRLARFRSVLIKVLAPAPDFESVAVNPVSKKVELRWKNYPCENVTAFQVWRRVARYDYDQPQCESGMPFFLHYNLIAELSGAETVYTDNHLAIGAQYCYRIVALLGSAKTPGRISIDTCIIPKPAEAPVITNVSVNKTHTTDGEIFVAWTSPFDIDPLQYPPPYEYKVYRGVGLDESLPYELVTPVPITDTVFNDTVLNTDGLPFRYKIELYVPSLTTLPVDTSSSASSVRLVTSPAPGSIILSWDANTPWYNYTQRYPYHLIFRATDPSGAFTLIDSVDVNKHGFSYEDKGQFEDTLLADHTEYYYKVLARGLYGNPKIGQPLENFSQISVNTIQDTIPPCPPVATMDDIDCKTFSCSGTNYFNSMTWNNGNTDCNNDVVAYKVYVRDESNPDFTLLTTLTENVFRHTSLRSRAKCYFVTAIDHAGNESEPSGEICTDNCPYFEVPNVFTPGNNDARNDYFMAYAAGVPDSSRCARFVLKVDVTIYDRWGQEIYSKDLAGSESSYILWDGYTRDGREVGSGVYYYAAHVLFDMWDPKQRHKLYKGWVQVMH